MIADELHDHNISIDKIRNDVKSIRKNRLTKKRGKSMYHRKVLDDSLAELIISRGQFLFRMRGLVNATETVLITPCTLCGDFFRRKNSCNNKTENSKPICYQCGSQDHLRKDCKNEPKCMTCEKKKFKDTNHIVGTMKCPSYIKAYNDRCAYYGITGIDQDKINNEGK